jgi:hypothetical protein
MGIPTLIKTLTASSASSLSFVDGTSDVVLDSTYDEYMFVLLNIDTGTDDAHFEFQGSTNGGSSYGVSKTTTAFYAYNYETSEETGVDYQVASDLANSTSAQRVLFQQNAETDMGGSGCFHLFSPSSTTYVKHFYSRTNFMHYTSYYMQFFVGGYFNTTSAIDAVQWAPSSGTFDGTIQLFGIS